MTETNSSAPSASPDQPLTASMPTDGAPAVADLQAQVDKWKAMSRKNEASYKDAARELEQLRAAGMSEQDRAIETARQEARTSALAELNERLVAAELKAQAAAAGTNLPDADFLNLNRFLDSEGAPDTEAIAAFVSALPATKDTPVYRQDLGLGRQGTSTAGQLTRSDLSRMTPAQVNKARDEGRLDALMRGEL